MANDYYSIITNTGLAKNAAASLGTKLNLTHLAIGDSNGTYYNPTGDATALKHELHRTTTTYVTIDEHNPNQLIVEAIIKEEAGPFYIREVGIFDADGDLFAIGKYPETFKPNLPSGSGKRLYVRMILGFTSSPQVNLVISDNLNYDPNFSTNVFNALGEKLSKAQNLSDVRDAEKSRANLGLKIGTDVQAYNGNLSALSAISGAANKVICFTGASQMGLADLFSNRNVIINGDFNIWQRGSSFPNLAAGTYTADRWQYYKSCSAVHSISQSNDVPTLAQAGRLFNSSLLISCTTAQPSVGSADCCWLAYKVEGYNFLPLAQKVVTLTFFVKATKAGIYSVAIRNFLGDRSYIKEFTVNAADTWEFKTLTFPPTPAGSWNYTNGVGLRITFALMAGSGWQNSTNNWLSLNYIASTNQVNAFDSISNTFSLCGVQLEAGSVATPFESRSIQQERLFCERYFEKSYDLNDAPGAINTGGAVRAFYVRNAAFRQNISFRVVKRAIPTLAYYNPVTGAQGQILYGWGGGPTTNSVLYEDANTTKWTAGTNYAQGTYQDAYFHWTADAECD